MLKKWIPRWDVKWMVILGAVALLVACVILPMMYLIYRSFVVGGVVDIQHYQKVYSNSVNWRALLNTLQVSLYSTGLALLISFPLAWLIGRTDLPGKGFFRTLFVATYMIPPYVGAIAWVQLLNPKVGFVNRFLQDLLNLKEAPFDIYSMAGLVWCLTLFYAPFAFITISRALEKMDPALEEASRISGARPLRTLWNITIPLMYPSILAGGVLVFIGVASAFGTPSIIGMPANIEVLTTRIVTYVYMGDTKGIQEATALAVSLMLAANALLYLSTGLLGRKEYVTISGKSTRPNLVELGHWKWPAFSFVTAYGVISVFLPLGSVLVTSMIKSMSRPVTWDNLTLRTWLAAVQNTQYMEPLWNSIILAVSAATISTIVGLLIAYLLIKTRVKLRSLPDALATLGGATPGVVIALALIITFSGTFGVNLYSTMSILVVAYMVKYLTMSVRTISASLSQVHPSLEEAALNSGATWLQSLRDIMWPLIKPSIVAGWFLVFMPSFYELTMSIILYGSQTKTIGVVLYELQTYADPQDASVLAVIILLIVLIGNLALRKFSKGEIGI